MVGSKWSAAGVPTRGPHHGADRKADDGSEEQQRDGAQAIRADGRHAPPGSSGTRPRGACVRDTVPPRQPLPDRRRRRLGGRPGGVQAAVRGAARRHRHGLRPRAAPEPASTTACSPSCWRRPAGCAVCEIKDGVAVEPDRVYVIPPEKDIVLADGRLKLVPRTDARPAHADRLLPAHARRRAEGHGDRRDPVRDGLGRDARRSRRSRPRGASPSPRSRARPAHDGMPRSAIAAGCVDFVLRPTAIARELARLGRHPYVRHRRSWRPARVPLRGRAGAASATASRRSSRSPRARPAPTSAPTSARRSSGASPAAWHSPASRAWRSTPAASRQRPRRCSALYQDCLITVTSFFRDPEAFEALASTSCPPLLENRPRGAAGARLGARLRDRRGGVLDRHLPARARGRAGEPARAADLRHRHLRGRARQGPRGRLPRDHRAGRLARAPAALLHPGRRRLPGEQDASASCASSPATT